MDWLAVAGYEHYEISNFARPGKRSRHNSSYWQGKPYLGLGPSAHSYNGESQRQWNVANNALYIDGLLQPEPLFPTLVEKEDLTRVQQLNEYIMISLRTMEGCDLQWVSRRFGEKAAAELYHQAQRYIREGKLTGEPGMETKLVLTREGRLLADGIAADLFFGA
jgi:oxygen-independent coproporphyrinogen-3 oxidase